MCSNYDESAHTEFVAPNHGRWESIVGTLTTGAVFVAGRKRNVANANDCESISDIGLAERAAAKAPERREFKYWPEGSDDVVIDILDRGVCHTDIHYFEDSIGRLEGSLVPGHDIMCRVREMRSSVSRFRFGDYDGGVTGIDSCGKCGFCRQGLDQYRKVVRTQPSGITRIEAIPAETQQTLDYSAERDLFSDIELLDRTGVKRPFGALPRTRTSSFSS